MAAAAWRTFTSLSHIVDVVQKMRAVFLTNDRTLDAINLESRLEENFITAYLLNG